MAGGIKGITVKIGGDTTELGKSLSSATKQSTALQRELKGVNTLLKFDPKNVTLLKQKADLLKQSITETKQKLHDLVEVQKKVDSGEIEMTEEEYRNLQREIASTQQALNRLTEEQRNFGSVGAQQIANVGKSLQDVGGKIENAGKKMTVLTGAIGAVAGASIASAKEMDEGYDIVITKTGATGDALDGLKAQVDTVFSTIPTTSADAGTAIGEVNTRFGLTGDALADLSVEFVKFANINGTDLNNSIDKVDSIMTKFGVDISDTKNVLGLMTKAGQDTGISMDSLENTLSTNGATLKEMGLDLTGAINLLAQFEANGVDAGTAMAGLKKAQQNATKEGKTLNESLGESIEAIKNASTETEALQTATELFGKKGAVEMTQAIREGRFSVDDLKTSLGEYGDVVTDTFEGTMSTWDETKIAMNNLKLEGSDLGETILTALAPVIEKVVDKIKEFTEWFRQLNPQVKTTIVIVGGIVAAIGPLLIVIGKLVASVGTIMTWVPKIASVFSTVGAGVGATLGPILAIVAVVGVLVGAFVTLWNTNKDFRENIISTWNSIKEKFVSFAQGITERVNALGFNFSSFGEMVKAAWGKLCEILAPIFEALFHQIGVILSSALDFLTGIFDIFIGIFTGDWSQAWEGVKEVFGSVWNLIKGTFKSWCMAFKGITSTILSWFGTSWSKVFTNVKKVVTKILTSIKNTISKIFNAIKSTISKVWNSIKNVTTKVWNGIKTTISNVLNRVKSTVSKAVNSIKSNISKVWNGIKSVTTKVWNGIKSAMIKPIESAESKIKKTVDKIKGFFSNLKLKIPKPTLPKLPHFTLTTGTKTIMGKEIKYPTGFDVQWYAKGGILKAPTIFGELGGKLLGGGEAGPEAVAPIDVLQKYVREAVSDRNVALEHKLDTMIGLMSNYYPEAIRAMDRPVVVGAKSIDTALADRNNKVVRGW